MFYPAMREPYFVTSGWALVGPGNDERGIALEMAAASSRG
jgi:hypothetical protein